MDFFRETLPMLAEGTGGIDGRIEIFDKQFLEERKATISGRSVRMLRLDHVHELDVYHSRQPRRVGPSHFWTS